MERMSYVIKRILWAVITLLAVITITFYLMHLIPGDPFLSEKATEENSILLREKYGLNEPLWIQLQKYLKELLKGDFGVSYVLQKNRPIGDILKGALTVSVKLGSRALAVAILFGISLGCLTGFYRGRFVDTVIRIFSTVGISVPGFVVASVLSMTFSVKLGVLPASGLEQPAGYVMPVTVLALQPTCYLIRLTRTSILEVLEQDYLRTIAAKGMSKFVVIFVHALKNSLIPILTYIGPLTASILTGGFVVESVFHIPGMGRYFVSAISCRDYTMIMAVTIVFAALMIAINLVCDILYQFIDPRIRLEH